MTLVVIGLLLFAVGTASACDCEKSQAVEYQHYSAPPVETNCPDYGSITGAIDNFKVYVNSNFKVVKQFGKEGYNVPVSSAGFKKLTAALGLGYPSTPYAFFPADIFNDVYVAADKGNCEATKNALKKLHF